MLIRRFLEKKISPGRGAGPVPLGESKIFRYFCGQNCPKVIKTLAASVGPGNFHYLAAIGGSDMGEPGLFL